eukprot:Rmarinus@m.9764
MLAAQSLSDAFALLRRSFIGEPAPVSSGNREDFIIFVEYGEASGGEVVFRFPTHPACGTFDEKDFLSRVFSCNVQDSGATVRAELPKDIHSVVSNLDEGYHAHVRVCCVHDLHARGCVRTCAFAFLTRNRRKLLMHYADFAENLGNMVRYVKGGCVRRAVHDVLAVLEEAGLCQSALSLMEQGFLVDNAIPDPAAPSLTPPSEEQVIRVGPRDYTPSELLSFLRSMLVLHAEHLCASDLEVPMHTQDPSASTLHQVTSTSAVTGTQHPADAHSLSPSRGSPSRGSPHSGAPASRDNTPRSNSSNAASGERDGAQHRPLRRRLFLKALRKRWMKLMNDSGTPSPESTRENYHTPSFSAGGSPADMSPCNTAPRPLFTPHTPHTPYALHTPSPSRRHSAGSYPQTSSSLLSTPVVAKSSGASAPLATRVRSISALCGSEVMDSVMWLLRRMHWWYGKDAFTLEMAAEDLSLNVPGPFTLSTGGTAVLDFGGAISSATTYAHCFDKQSAEALSGSRQGARGVGGAGEGRRLFEPQGEVTPGVHPPRPAPPTLRVYPDVEEPGSRGESSSGGAQSRRRLSGDLESARAVRLLPPLEGAKGDLSIEGCVRSLSVSRFERQDSDISSEERRLSGHCGGSTQEPRTTDSSASPTPLERRRSPNDTNDEHATAVEDRQQPAARQLPPSGPPQSQLRGPLTPASARTLTPRTSLRPPAEEGVLLGEQPNVTPEYRGPRQKRHGDSEQRRCAPNAPPVTSGLLYWHDTFCRGSRGMHLVCCCTSTPSENDVPEFSYSHAAGSLERGLSPLSGSVPDSPHDMELLSPGGENGLVACGQHAADMSSLWEFALAGGPGGPERGRGLTGVGFSPNLAPAAVRARMRTRSGKRLAQPSKTQRSSSFFFWRDKAKSTAVNPQPQALQTQDGGDLAILLGSLLTGRPVIITGPSNYKADVTQLATMCAAFVPSASSEPVRACGRPHNARTDARNHLQHTCVLWRTTPISQAELAQIAVCGIASESFSKVDAANSPSVLPMTEGISAPPPSPAFSRTHSSSSSSEFRRKSTRSHTSGSDADFVSQPQGSGKVDSDSTVGQTHKLGGKLQHQNQHQHHHTNPSLSHGDAQHPHNPHRARRTSSSSSAGRRGTVSIGSTESMEGVGGAGIVQGILRNVGGAHYYPTQTEGAVGAKNLYGRQTRGGGDKLMAREEIVKFATVWDIQEGTITGPHFRMEGFLSQLCGYPPAGGVLSGSSTGLGA